MLPALLLLTAPLQAAPSCPPYGAGAQSTNWGAGYRERVREIFEVVKDKAGAGIDPGLLLINVNDLPANRYSRLINGSPLLAVKRGTQGLPHDAILYTFGVFEAFCDEAQLAFFMAHEMRHVKKDASGQNHFDRGSACLKGLFLKWANGTDLEAYPDAKSTFAAFEKSEAARVQEQCVRPVEDEADRFALELSPKLPWTVETDPENPDPNRDARVRAFRDAERWLQALGAVQPDPGHAVMAARAQAAARAALAQAEQRLQKNLAVSVP